MALQIGVPTERAEEERRVALVPEVIARFDVWVMLGAAILLVVFAVTGWRVSRREGAVFLLAYAIYLFMQMSSGTRAAIGLE